MKKTLKYLDDENDNPIIAEEEDRVDDLDEEK
jgi:hypothetical protein